MQIAHYVLLALVVLVALIAATQWKQLKAAFWASRKFLQEVKVEMQKVTWPSRNEVIGSLMVVMTAIIFLTVVITVWDQILSQILRVILPGKGI